MFLTVLMTHKSIPSGSKEPTKLTIIHLYQTSHKLSLYPIKKCIKKCGGGGGGEIFMYPKPFTKKVFLFGLYSVTNFQKI
jgi:hypothetical protein